MTTFEDTLPALADALNDLTMEQRMRVACIALTSLIPDLRAYNLPASVEMLLTVATILHDTAHDLSTLEATQ